MPTLIVLSSSTKKLSSGAQKRVQQEEFSPWNKLHEVLSKTFLDKAVISSAALAAGEPLLFFPRFLSAMVT